MPQLVSQIADRNLYVSPNKFVLPDYECFDVDECILQNIVTDFNHDCSETAKCKNTDGAYDCECKVGFRGSGFGDAGCIDIGKDIFSN